MTDTGSTMTLGACATLACLWEATAPKPGNVYRGADFDDMNYADFVTSAAVIGPVIDRCHELGLGGTVLEAVKATRQAVGVNTNLGTLLLIAPLAKAATAAWSGASWTVHDATQEDTRRVYEAIRIASPGGLGKVDEGDIACEPQHALVDAMRLAADRDLIARQYTNGFTEVRWAADEIEKWRVNGLPLTDAIVAAQLRLLADHGDSLVCRKLGPAVTQELQDRAATVVAAISMEDKLYVNALADFDFWLRADGHCRNPGTTADLIAAGLFVLLVEDRLNWPVRFYS